MELKFQNKCILTFLGLFYSLIKSPLKLNLYLIQLSQIIGALLRNSEFTTNRSQNSEQNSSVIPAIYQAIRH